MTPRQAESGDIEGALKNWLTDSRRVAIIGIGNPLRRDDFVGMKVVEALQGRVSKSVCLVECETSPESFVEPIIKFGPTRILIVDAAVLSLNPGSWRLVNPEQIINRPAISTHALSLRIFCEYLTEAIGAKIAVLAIQPGDSSFGEGLTREVEKTAKHLVDLLSNILA
jgi:hydrogenase 3 maturation protease